MKDLLAHLQISPSPTDNYVCFKGSDGYGASVPLKYLDDILISYQMNSQDIPLDHGPIRVICPGIVAARSVKWVSSIYFSPFESDSHYQQKDYKGFSPSKSASEYDYSKSESINELPVTCAITSPAPGDTINPSGLSVKGYSYAGGGRSIVRVDVSINGGLTWQDAVLDKPQQPAGKTFAWTLWEAKFEIENPKQDLNIVCKAVDQGYNTQPDSFEGIWNARGVLSNAWHRIRLLGKSQS
jgi:sulfite oxidase